MSGVDVLALSKALFLPPNRGVVPREASLAATSLAVGGWATITSITGEGWLIALTILPGGTRDAAKWRVTIDGGTAFEIASGNGASAGATVTNGSGTTIMIGGVLALSPAVHFRSSILVEAGHSFSSAQTIAAGVVYALSAL